MIGISIDSHPFEMPILASRLGGMMWYITVQEPAPHRGVIFGGSRIARPPQPPKINFIRNPPQANIRSPFYHYEQINLKKT